MPERSDRRRAAVLVITKDEARRVTLERACRAAGVPARGVSSVSELERWPVGQIVITDVGHLSPWWRHIGAVEVIALVDDAEEGMVALQNGATQWLDSTSTATRVATIVRILAGWDS
jgi:hypothetical protein